MKRAILGAILALSLAGCAQTVNPPTDPCSVALAAAQRVISYQDDTLANLLIYIDPKQSAAERNAASLRIQDKGTDTEVLLRLDLINAEQACHLPTNETSAP